MAILKLEQEVKLDKKVQIACLPLEVSVDYPPPFMPVYAIGWGTMAERNDTTSDVLRNVELITLNSTLCRVSHSKYQKDAQFCACDPTLEGKSVCHGNQYAPSYIAT